MKSKDMSRRKFMRNLGSGVIGTGVALHLPAQGATAEKEVPSEQTTGKTVPLQLTVNSKAYNLRVPPASTLAEVLREQLQLTGTKVSCNHGACGSCTVLLDDIAVYSCHLLAQDAAGHRITTIEGLMDGENLHPLQQAFVDKDGLQCGFCTPGQVMAAEALLRKNPNPTREEVLRAMSGNLCRCAAYPNIIDSVLDGAQKRQNEMS